MFASPSGSLCSPLKPQKGTVISHPPPVKAIGYIGGEAFVWPHKACLKNFGERRDSARCEGEVQSRSTLSPQPQQF